MSRKIFDHQPSLQEYFETSDGKKFYSHNSATNHAKTLSNKAVKNFKREEDVAGVTSEDLSAEEAQKLANEKAEADAIALEESEAMAKAEAAVKEAKEPQAKAKEETAAKKAEAPIKKMVPAKNTNKKPSNTVK